MLERLLYFLTAASLTPGGSRLTKHGKSQSERLAFVTLMWKYMEPELNLTWKHEETCVRGLSNTMIRYVSCFFSSWQDGDFPLKNVISGIGGFHHVLQHIRKPFEGRPPDVFAMGCSAGRGTLAQRLDGLEGEAAKALVAKELQKGLDSRQDLCAGACLLFSFLLTFIVSFVFLELVLRSRLGDSQSA